MSETQNTTRPCDQHASRPPRRQFSIEEALRVDLFTVHLWIQFIGNRAPDRNSTCTGVLVPYVLFGTRTVYCLWPSLYWTVYWTGLTSIHPSLIWTKRSCAGYTGHIPHSFYLIASVLRFARGRVPGMVELSLLRAFYLCLFCGSAEISILYGNLYLSSWLDRRRPSSEYHRSRLARRIRPEPNVNDIKVPRTICLYIETE